MKNKKLNKRFLQIIALCILILVIVFLVIAFRKPKLKGYDKYAISIIVESTKENEVKETTTIDIKDDGSAAEVSTSFMMNPIYVSDKGTVYENGGRLKKVKTKSSYRNVYDALTKIDFETEDGNYHPTVSKEIINELLRSLFIDYEINKDSVGNLIISEGNIEEFSIYLRNFYGYDKLGIIVTFEEMEKDYKVNAPVLYDEVIDEVEERELRFIN